MAFNTASVPSRFTGRTRKIEYLLLSLPVTLTVLVALMNVLIALLTIERPETAAAREP